MRAANRMGVSAAPLSWPGSGFRACPRWQSRALPTGPPKMSELKFDNPLCTQIAKTSVRFRAWRESAEDKLLQNAVRHVGGHVHGEGMRHEACSTVGLRVVGVSDCS